MTEWAPTASSGYHAAQAIRERDEAGGIVVYGDTGLAPYNPMLTTYHIFGKLPRSGLFPFGPLEGIADRLGLTFHHERVVKVRARDLTVEAKRHENRTED